MDVVLHIGAHRTGTSTFQDYMRRHIGPLEAMGIGYWGPQKTRSGLFSGLGSRPDAITVNEPPERSEGRIRMQLRAARARGIKTLVISDADMAGSISHNIDNGCLYAGIGERVVQYARACAGHLSSVVISPRSLELYWSSALSCGIVTGHNVLDRKALHGIAHSPRGWRDVITDLARALPGAEIKVTPFEAFAGRPEVFLARAVGDETPTDMNRVWLNRAPNLADLRRALIARGVSGAVLPFGMERWNPFTPEENAALRETYADDMMWLVAGADGLATLTEDQARTRAGKILPAGAQTQGHADEHEKRHVARPG